MQFAELKFNIFELAYSKVYFKFCVQLQSLKWSIWTEFKDKFEKAEQIF
jgi:hypothetical protein